jgi:hypothetical protein
MRAYIYRAALHCERCTNLIKSDLTAPANPGDENTFDSDDYPKGPYSDGGGESDCPQHCDTCGQFLENPLTTDGIAYIREQIRKANPMHPSPAILEWAAFYRHELCECNTVDFEDADECITCHYAAKDTRQV